VSSERLAAGEITEEQLTVLYDRLAQAGRTTAGLQAANQRPRDRLERIEQEGRTDDQAP
jgi:hypothetical protein